MAYTTRPENWDWRTLEARCRREVARVLRGSNEIEDVVQEALARAWRFRGSCRTPEAPDAWCASIARNEAMRLLKDRAAQTRSSLEVSPEVADRRASSEFEAAAIRVDLNRALEEGSAQERSVLLLRYRADLSTGEIARLLSLNETTARVQLHRAKKRLRDRMSA